jgi:hypothetical protein
MSYKVSSADLSSISLMESDVVQSVLQNIAVLLATPKGSVPMYRDFGLDQSFLDKPIPAAQPMMVAAIIEAIDQYEPRARVVDVTFAIDESHPGKLIPTVEVEINES